MDKTIIRPRKFADSGQALPHDPKFRVRVRANPEGRVKTALVQYLNARGWRVELTHGNRFQTGFPDLYAFHLQWGQRWIDVKTPGHYTFTIAQRIKWPIWDDYKIGIWILTAATQVEYNKLFAPPNWRDYWKPSWSLPNVSELLKGLENG